MRRLLVLTLAIAVLAASAQLAGASLLFKTTLLGSNEVPPTGSRAVGLGSVLLNDAENQVTVDLSFTGLTAPATAAHVHGPALPGVNAPVIFGFTGIPSATSGAIPEQSFAITPTQVLDLKAGLYYMNIHDSNFPGGEIRGQLYAVPEASTLMLAVLGLGSAAGVLRRRR